MKTRTGTEIIDGYIEGQGKPLFPGKKDSNGKIIYDGDILQIIGDNINVVGNIYESQFI